MKSNIIKILVLALLIVSCQTQKPLEPGHYRINGTVNGLENGELYTMAFPNGVDTIKVENGKFQIENELKETIGNIYLVDRKSVV